MTLIINAGRNNDTVTVNALDDLFLGKLTVAGAAGADHLDATAAGTGVRLLGGSGNDRLLGSPDDDNIRGGGGNDVLTAGGGIDIVRGDGGNDRLTESVSGHVRVDDGIDLARPGHRTRMLTIESVLVTGSAGDDDISLMGFDGPETLNGTDGDDTLRGTSHDDRILSGIGNDVTFGEGGEDTILGSSGRDTVDGGSGDDQLDGGSGDDVVIGAAGDDLVLGGGGHDTLSGNAGLDIVVGANGSDVLFAYQQGGLSPVGDRDILIGGRHRDTLNGGNGEDLLISGRTDFDNMSGRLTDIRAEWTAPTPQASRIANLRDGSGAVPGQNGTTFLKAGTTVTDRSWSDQLFGNGEIDWFFAQTSDQTDRNAATETLDIL